jgi:phospholipid/cholesterol/gamma-HCH transport system substrate-binding protein
MKASAPLLLIALLVPTGCSGGTAGLPLPGGAPSGPSYRVTAEFTDVLDLVPHAAVKVDDVTVGSVEQISLSGWTARVRLRIGRSVVLPANATAAVRQTSLLGEKYVALDPPTTEPARGRLADGAVVPLSRTRRGAEVEEVLAALGMLLNGGGLAQLKTINEELAKAFAGREPAARGALQQLDTFIGGLDRQKAGILDALDAMDRLTAHLAQQRAVIGSALDALAPGLTVLAGQRAQLTTALTALGDLGRVGTRVVEAARAGTVASLKALEPILDQLVRAGDALPKSLDFLLTFPFPPNASGAIVGDFANLSATADLDATTILANLLVVAPGQPLRGAAAPGSAGGPAAGPTAKAPKPSGPAKPGGPSKPTGPSLPLPALPGVLALACLPLGLLLPPGWLPPSGCALPPGCRLLGPLTALPAGGIRPPGGVVPPGTVFPAGTLLVPGTGLTPQCLLPATGATSGAQGGLTDVLTGGLKP